MDAHPPPSRALDDQDESVRIAVKALGDMRNSHSRTDNSRSRPQLALSSSSYASSSASKSPPLSPSSPQSRESSREPGACTSPAFVSRMSHLPLVGSALRVYEQGKASSRVVKYGAEMVESSVKSISRPVIDRLPVNVNQLDEFACRQLDKLDRYRRPSTGSSSTPAVDARSPTSTDASTSEQDRGRPKLKTKTLDGSAIDDRDVSMQRDEPSSSKSRAWGEPSDRSVPNWLEATSPFIAPPPPPPPDERSATPTQNRDSSQSNSSHSHTSTTTSSGSERQVAQRSRWQAVLLEAGGLSAALSEESMRRLKYCLQWLQYATAHIDAQILILRDFTANLQPLPSDDLSLNRRPPISDEHMRKLTEVRRDIVHTIRQVVDVVSKYAGGALPEPARNRVRGFILKLPQRWASKAGPAQAGTSAAAITGERETVAAAGSGTGALRRPGGQRRAAHRERGAGAAEGMRSGGSSRAPSPSSSPRMSRAALRHGDHPEGGNGDHSPVSHGSALLAAQRILALATESLDMMRNVTGVMKESLDRADAWVGRLRTVGIQRGAQEGEDDTEGSEFDFPPSSPHRRRHRRTDSTQSAYDDQDTGSGMPSPFFSGASTNWGSSIPSTPGGAYTPVNSSFAYAGNAPSPGAIHIPIGSMSLGSRYNTPKSTVVGLPDEEEEGEEEESGRRVEKMEVVNSKPAEATGDVKVVGVDAEIGEEDEETGIQKMDVDV